MSSTCSHSLIIGSSSTFSTDATGSWYLSSPRASKVCSTSNAVGRSLGSWLQQASICSHSVSTNFCEGLADDHSGRNPLVILSTISSSLLLGNGVVPDKTCEPEVRCSLGLAEKTHFKHDHRKGINVSSLSTVLGRNMSALGAENLRCHPSHVGRDRPGRSLVAQESFEAVPRDTGDSIAVNKDVVLRGYESHTLDEKTKTYPCQVPMNQTMLM